MFLRTVINNNLESILTAAGSIGNDMQRARSSISAARAAWLEEMSKIIQARDVLDEREAQCDERFNKAVEETEAALTAIGATMGDAPEVNKIVKLEKRAEA